jgi:hypothetical protein
LSITVIGGPPAGGNLSTIRALGRFVSLRSLSGRGGPVLCGISMLLGYSSYSWSSIVSSGLTNSV